VGVPTLCGQGTVCTSQLNSVSTQKKHDTQSTVHSSILFLGSCYITVDSAMAASKKSARAYIVHYSPKVSYLFMTVIWLFGYLQLAHMKELHHSATCLV
jgi:hypothetical protein